MRDYRIDNAKGFLIFLVVLGHFLESINGWMDAGLRAPLTFMYMLHMPAFVFLAGATAKPGKIAQRIPELALIFILFQTAYALPIYASTGSYPGNALQPYWMLWFLVSLICWLALLPLIRRMRFALATSVVISLVIGLIPWVGYDLSLSRTFSFLPFFVAGHLYGWTLLKRIPEKPLLSCFASLAIVAVAAALYAFDLGAKWFHGTTGYEALGVAPVSGILIKFSLIMAASIASVLLFVAIPSRRTWLSTAGERSLAVFLLHGFVVSASIQQLYAIYANYGAVHALAASLILASLTTAILATPVFDQTIRKYAGSLAQLFRARATIERSA